MLSKNETELSPSTSLPMQNIGFVEKSDDNKVDMIKFLVDSAKGINTIKMTQEDSMTDENTNEVAAEEVAVAETVEVAPEADAAVTEEVAEVEKAAMPEDEESPEEEEAEGESEDDEEVEKSEAADAVVELKDAVTSAFSELTAVVKSLSDEIAELKKSVGHIDAKVNDAESDFNNLGKRIDAVEADTAFRKSGDLGEIVQEPAMVEKSVWGGRFLKTSDLFR